MTHHFVWQLHSRFERQDTLERLKADLGSIRAQLLETRDGSGQQLTCMIELKEYKLETLYRKLSDWAMVRGAKDLGKLCAPREAVLYIQLHLGQDNEKV